MKPNVKVVNMVHMLTDYPSQFTHILSDTQQYASALFKGRDYQVCAMLEIGYFVLLSGRLVYLPVEFKDKNYTVYQKCVDL